MIAGVKLKSASWLLACAVLLPALAGCTAGTGSDQQVNLVITPVATPTSTPLAAATFAPVTYTVKPGDTLSGIAAMFGVTVDDIVRGNNITDANVLSDGQVLNIPMRSPEGTPTEVPVGSPSPQSTPPSLVSPTLPPANATPPQGPDVPEPTEGGSSAPGITISPTAAP